MLTTYKKKDRYSPLIFRDGLTLRNRVVVPAMASETGDEQGQVTAATLQHYSRLTRAGTGLIIVEYTYVHSSGRSELGQLGLSEDSQRPGLKKISQVIRESGAVSLLQLTHSGGKSSKDLTGGHLFAPSAIAVPVKDRSMEVPEAMSPSEIRNWKEMFLRAAKRASQAGFQGVELHSAHGYGLNQWLSPITNQRADEYGGSLENRARLLQEIVTSIRQEIPQFLISVRIPGQDFIPGGLSLEDMSQVARWLEECGVDIINVSSGIGGWRRPQSREGEGYLVEEARRIQMAVEIPVIGVGGIKTGKYIDQVIGDGSLSLVAVGRALLEDPQRFAEHVLPTSHAPVVALL